MNQKILVCLLRWKTVSKYRKTESKLSINRHNKAYGDSHEIIRTELKKDPNWKCHNKSLHLYSLSPKRPQLTNRWSAVLKTSHVPMVFEDKAKCTSTHISKEPPKGEHALRRKGNKPHGKAKNTSVIRFDKRELPWAILCSRKDK